MKKRANAKLPGGDNPEWTDADFKRAVPLSGLPKSLQTKLRGRPPKEAPKVPVKLRLDPDVLAVLRATGAGWQTRVNAILRERFAL
jgi:uncharacterized protein (DUF4415 family)